MTISQAFALAIQHHQAGRLAEAEAVYRQILAEEPNYADALHHLGVIAHQRGRHDLAVEWIGQAIALNPNNPATYSNLGEACRKLGRLDEAITSFRRALDLKPGSPETCNNLGNALLQRNQLSEAVAAYRGALELRPDYPDAQNNLGGALAKQGQLAAAVAAYRRALQLKPDYPEAHYNLGTVLASEGRLDEAVVEFRRALELKPDYPEARNNLGGALAGQGQFDEAVTAYRRALQIQPDFAAAHYNLGNAFRDCGQFDEAVASYRRALDLKPDYSQAHNDLAGTLAGQGRLDEAMAACRRALELRPDCAEAWNNLGGALAKRGRLDEATDAYRRALEIRPDYAEACNNLGGALTKLGLLDEAVAAYRQALELQPDRAEVHSNLVLTLHLHPGHDDGTIAGEHRRWNRRFSDPLKRLILPHFNDHNAERRLRIGYVSPDFRSHPVSFFLALLLEAHDHRQYEVFCYANVQRPDAVTERLRKSADVWRDVRTLPDAQLAGCIQQDRIDILVDLAMHTADNRLPVFARKPAPVQVSWLAYPGSTGLETIDFRLTDAFIEPAGQDDAGSGTPAIRLPDSWCCYAPIEEFPQVSPLPAAQTGTVTFGSLNEFGKIHEELLRCWARLLRAMPESRLVMVCPQGHAQERTHALLAVHGVPRERVELVSFHPWPGYIRLFERIDLALDSFPCNGMTTTCHALWMGVPVVTLAGTRAVSRAGSSLLHTIGLRELVAFSEDEYVGIASQLGRDLPRLAGMRRTLRPRMEASPLMDAPRFARNMETAYRAMWRCWCAGTQS